MIMGQFIHDIVQTDLAMSRIFKAFYSPWWLIVIKNKTGKYIFVTDTLLHVEKNAWIYM
jgi:hypothetical protein